MVLKKKDSRAQDFDSLICKTGLVSVDALIFSVQIKLQAI